jgi:S-adenosylmethionine hydrolase
MPVVTLTTEWKNSDFYLGVIKGILHAKIDDLKLIDISHEIPKYNIAQAAFTVRNCYHHFPDGTIHLIAVKSEATEESPFIVVQHDNQYFIGADNGVFGLIFDNKPEKIIEINMIDNEANNEIHNSTFPENTVLTKAGVFIANGGDFNQLGTEKEKLFRQIPLRPIIEESVIDGSIIYIDSYKNVISNITERLFEKVGQGRPFTIYIHSNYYKVTKLNTSYNETSDGEILALFNSLGLLEIAINKGNASELLNLNTKSNIRIKFHDHPNS